jgi:hypothetical protein
MPMFWWYGSREGYRVHYCRLLYYLSSFEGSKKESLTVERIQSTPNIVKVNDNNNNNDNDNDSSVFIWKYIWMSVKSYITWNGFSFLITSTKKEYPDKYGWWINELESLGLAVNKVNELNNIKEVSSLSNNIKQVLFQDYKTLYNKPFKDISFDC